MLRIARCWGSAVDRGCVVRGNSRRGDPLGDELAASVQGPYPVGNPSAQPNLSLAFLPPKRGRATSRSA